MWEEICSGGALFIFNAIDAVCGSILIVYSLYLGLNHYAPEWLYLPIFIVGAIILVAVFMSWCGSSNYDYSVCLSLSSSLLLFVAFSELIFALIILTKGPEIDQFLRNHQRELKLTDIQLLHLEKEKFIPAYLLISLFAMEIIRFCCSSGLANMRYHRKYQYKKLDAITDLEEELLDTKREHDISEKYINLKSKYKIKYPPNTV